MCLWLAGGENEYTRKEAVWIVKMEAGKSVESNLSRKLNVELGGKSLNLSGHLLFSCVEPCD